MKGIAQTRSALTITMDDNKLVSVCRQFGIDGVLVGSKAFTDGHINSTYLAEFEKDGETHKYLVQNINTHVFKDPDLLMNNIVDVTAYLKRKIAKSGGDPNRETLSFIKANDGRFYFPDGKNCWRMYHFIDRSFTYDLIDSEKIFENAGKSFGRFQRLLNDYPADRLKETIPDFHNTPKRVEALRLSAEKNAVGRAKEVQAELGFAFDRKDCADIVLNLFKDGKIPLRVTHNDTKLNNILFDENTNEGLCVIDLDTIMPGFSLYDFGDAIRFGAKTAFEDEADLSKVSVSVPLYESYVKGYLSECALALTKAEIDHLAFSAKLMTYECGVRFLTDYLDGDVYFKTDYPEHNLVRARNQFKMVSEIEKRLDEMNKIAQRVYAEYVK